MGPLKLSTAKAYQMPRTLQDIYASADDRRANRRLRAWVHYIRILHAKNPWLAPMAKLAETTANPRDGIHAH